jgi:hypothetical protein
MMHLPVSGQIIPVWEGSSQEQRQETAAAISASDQRRRPAAVEERGMIISVSVPGTVEDVSDSLN